MSPSLQRARGARLWLSLACFAIATIAAGGWRSFALPANDAAVSRVDLGGRARIIDGDTLEIAATRIRLWGVDAPERHQRCAAGLPGPQATAALSRVIDGQPVTCRTRDHDRYGRTVAQCAAGGVDLGGRMVSEGWAWDYARYSGGRYRAEQAEAEQAGRGIWAMGCEPAWEWRHNGERG